MKHIFYFIGILFIIHEIIWIISPKSQALQTKLITDLSKQFKDKKWDDYSKEYKDILITRGLTSLIFILWVLGGLLTFNWFAFAVFFLFNIIIIMPLGKLFKFSFAYTVLHWFNSVIGLAFAIFVIINSYHLKINLYEFIKSRWF